MDSGLGRKPPDSLLATCWEAEPPLPRWSASEDSRPSKHSQPSRDAGWADALESRWNTCLRAATDSGISSRECAPDSHCASILPREDSCHSRSPGNFFQKIGDEFEFSLLVTAGDTDPHRTGACSAPGSGESRIPEERRADARFGRLRSSFCCWVEESM